MFGSSLRISLARLKRSKRRKRGRRARRMGSQKDEILIRRGK